MKVGVTGGCGFIGSHVVDKLIDAHVDVRVLDAVQHPHRDDVECIAVDIMDQDALNAATRGLDVVYHLAAVADVNNVVADPAGSVALNVLPEVSNFASSPESETKRQSRATGTASRTPIARLTARNAVRQKVLP